MTSGIIPSIFLISRLVERLGHPDTSEASDILLMVLESCLYQLVSMTQLIKTSYHDGMFLIPKAVQCLAII